MLKFYQTDVEIYRISNIDLSNIHTVHLIFFEDNIPWKRIARLA